MTKIELLEMLTKRARVFRAARDHYKRNSHMHDITKAPPLCDWCAKNLVENTQMCLDSRFYKYMCQCAPQVRGVIVLDGNKSRLVERIRALIDDAENVRLYDAVEERK